MESSRIQCKARMNKRELAVHCCTPYTADALQQHTDELGRVPEPNLPQGQSQTYHRVPLSSAGRTPASVEVDGHQACDAIEVYLCLSRSPRHPPSPSPLLLLATPISISSTLDRSIPHRAELSLWQTLLHGGIEASQSRCVEADVFNQWGGLWREYLYGGGWTYTGILSIGFFWSIMA